MVGDTCSPTSSMRNLTYFLADATKTKSRVHQLDFIGAFLQAKLKNRFFFKLDIRYTYYFPEYAKCFGRALESFQLHMGLSFSFLRANDLRSSLLNIIARSFLLSCT